MTSTHSATVALPTDTQILITRKFDAPPRLVWEASTKPELIKKWWAGQRGTVTDVEVDLRPGGRWRYVMVANEGFEVAFHGEYKEIVLHEKVVHTEAFEGIPDADENAALVTVTFTEVDGGTLLTSLIEHRNQAGRDAHINSGMEAGMQESLDLLEQVAIALS